MPELPEVETIARSLRQGQPGVPPLPGLCIQQAQFLWPRALVDGTPADAAARLAGQSVLQVVRRAKWICLGLSRDSLLIHLRMSGDLRVEPASSAMQPHDRFWLEFQGGWRLILNDTRKFGRIWLTADPQAALAGLGPEPLEDAFTAESFTCQLQARHRLIKPLLLDQSFLAGLGNIYTDEALHRAGIHPLRSADSLTPAEAARLWAAIRAVLTAGIQHNGASIDWVYRGGGFQNHFQVYGRAGQACPTCGHPVQRMVVGQRGTHLCPFCQPLAGDPNPTGEIK